MSRMSRNVGVLFDEMEARLSRLLEEIVTREKETLRKDMAAELSSAVDAACSCGGNGPDHLDCCPACQVYHRIQQGAP